MVSAETIAFNERRQTLEQRAKRHICAVCGGRLAVAMRAGQPTLRCTGKCNGYITDTATVRYKGYFRQRLEEVYGQEGKPMTTQALTTMTEQQMLTRIGMAKFPQELSPVDKRALAQAAISYGFDPLMNEISIYQGRPYVSIDGRYRKAQETGRLAGVETRPATSTEREAWEIPTGDYFFRSEVYVKDIARPFVGWGRVFQAEVTGGKGFKPVEKNPQRMAEKRAEAQALRKAFSIPLPSLEDIGGPEDDAPVPPPIRIVDTKTGEVKTPVNDVQEDEPEAPATPEELAKAFQAPDLTTEWRAFVETAVKAVGESRFIKACLARNLGIDKNLLVVPEGMTLDILADMKDKLRATGATK